MRWEKGMQELVVEAKDENLGTILDVIEEKLDQMECPMKVHTQIAIAVEEIFVNIAHYAYGDKTGTAKVEIDTEDSPRKSMSLIFTDSGQPYDPLAKPDPDITLSADERQIGGLGIFMVKKSMDEIDYHFVDGHNVLKIKKYF